MTLSPRKDLTLTCKATDAWAALERELDMWRKGNVPATLWWRDDDAQLPCPQLEHLLGLSLTSSTPLVLATIPHSVDSSLSAKIKPIPNLTIVQHGWSHSNHAPASEKKCELGDHRPLCEIERELTTGAEILFQLFDDMFSPVLVPPWNRISTTVASNLKKYGYVGLSTFGDKKIVQSVSGFCQANTHVDLINWRGNRAFIGTENALQQITTHLLIRRCGDVPHLDATGILTHHLDHDEKLWRFLEEFFQFTAEQSAVHWQTGQQVFGA